MVLEYRLVIAASTKNLYNKIFQNLGRCINMLVVYDMV